MIRINIIIITENTNFGKTLLLFISFKNTYYIIKIKKYHLIKNIISVKGGTKKNSIQNLYRKKNSNMF